MFEDLLGIKRAEKKQQIDDNEEKANDPTWQRPWSTYQDLDLSFLEDDLEPTLFRLKARLEEEELLTISEVVARDASGGGHDEVSSQCLNIPLFEAAISTRLETMMDEVNETLITEATHDAQTEMATNQEPAEAIPVDNIPIPES